VDIPLIVLFVGILIFLGHLFESIFDLFKIPDLLLLMLIGLISGPILGLVSLDQFGVVGPIFAIITLIIILFEGGLNLRFEVIAGSLARAKPSHSD
jgi:cell volume regulation protein A